MIKDWNEKNHYPAGTKGFRKLSEKSKKASYTAVKFTAEQKAMIKNYCINENIGMSEMIRQSVYEYLKKDNFFDKYKKTAKNTK